MKKLETRKQKPAANLLAQIPKQRPLAEEVNLVAVQRVQSKVKPTPTMKRSRKAEDFGTEGVRRLPGSLKHLGG